MKTFIVLALFFTAALAVAPFNVPKYKECKTIDDCGDGECCARERDPRIMSRREVAKLKPIPFKPFIPKSYCKPYKQLGQSCGSTFWTGNCPCANGMKCKFFPLELQTIKPVVFSLPPPIKPFSAGQKGENLVKRMMKSRPGHSECVKNED